MKAEQFLKLIENPLLVEEDQITDLERLVHSYPYFQSASLLYTKALESFNHINYHQSLKKASAIAGDRKVLFRLIKSKRNFIADEKTSNAENNTQTSEEITNQSNLNQQSVIENIEFISNYEVSPAVYRKDVYVVNNDASSENKSQLIPQTVEEKTDVVVESNITTTRKKMPHDLDDLMAKAVVNAYYEKEVLKVTEIDKGQPKPDQEINVEKIDHSKDQHDFTSWLKALNKSEPKKAGQEEKTNKPEQIQEAIIKKEHSEKTSIIDKIISEQPKISKINQEKTFFSAINTARESVLDDESLVTETLARIYFEQGNLAKAIRSYEILSLKFPKKSSYFATLIKEIKNKTK